MIARLRVTVVILSVVLLAAGTSCQRAAPDLGIPGPPPSVVVRMSEYRFSYAQPTLAGRVLFEVRNIGREDHRLALVRLPEDLPPLDAQLHGSERRVLVPFAGVPVRRPGQDGAFAVDLVAGQRYGLICNLTNASGEVHSLRGMNSEFVAGA